MKAIKLANGLYAVIWLQAGKRTVFAVYAKNEDRAIHQVLDSLIQVEALCAA